MTARFRAVLLAAIIMALTATASRAVAAEPEVYFPETGHYVRGAFLTFFQQHGEITIFGYPRTEEVVEDGRTVQYFQRARFEYWPENPDPYKVQLTLLGEIVSGPVDPPLPTGEIPSAADRSRRYFAETGHTIAFAFLDFYDSKGGLDVFGYPISEIKTVSGALIQNFQRARFEWHPENPEPYRVQLGLLGDEYIYQMGKVALSLTQPLTDPATVPVSSTAASAVSASSSGKLAIMLSPGGDVVVVNADGTGLRRVTHGFDPAWSPDGRRLAVTRWDMPWGIYVVNAETGAETHLYWVQSARLPSWSPNGETIAFQDYFLYQYRVRGPGGWMEAVDHRYRISAIDKAGGSATGFPSELHSFSPSWAPDSRSIVFKGDKGLYITDQQNGSRLVPGTDPRYSQPVYSPDGKKIAFVWKQHDHTEIAVINWDGSGFQILTNTQVFGQQASNNVSPAWSPDGRKIAFVTDREGDWKVYVMNADGSDQSKFLDIPITYQSASERIVSWGQ